MTVTLLDDEEDLGQPQFTPALDDNDRDNEQLLPSLFNYKQAQCRSSPVLANAQSQPPSLAPMDNNKEFHGRSLS